LDHASRLWDAGGREDSDLYRGTRLEAARDWVDAHEAALNATERAFLDASIAGAARAQDAQLRANRRLRRLIGGIVLLLVAALGLAVFALISRGQAVSAKTAAKAQALAAESENQQSVDPELAVLLAIEAVRTKPTAETMFALRQAIDVYPIRYRLARAPVQNCGGPGISYDPGRGGRTLVEALCSGELRFFDAETGRLERTVRLPGRPDGMLAFTADGSSLLVAASNRVIALDPVTGAVRRASPAVPDLVAFTVAPHAPVVAILARNELDFWNVATGRLTITRPRRLLAYEQADVTGERPPQANRFAFSPDGRRLAFAFYTVTEALVMYDIRRQAIVATLREPGPATAVAFTPDGQRLVLGYDGKIVLLNSRTLAVDQGFSPITDPGNVPTALAVRPDASAMAYGFTDGTAGLAADGRVVATYRGGTSPVWQTSFSADGRLVATSYLDGTVTAWRASGFAPQPVHDGGWLETNEHGLVVLWPRSPVPGWIAQRLLADGRPADRPLVVSSAPGIPGDQPGISPGGRFVVLVPQAPAGRETMRVWDVINRRVVRRVHINESLLDSTRPAISPDGNLVVRGVTISPSRFDLRMLDLRSGRSRVVESTACAAGWQAIAFSKSGRLLFAGTNCGSASVSNAATGRPEGGRIAFGTHQVRAAAFSPDDHHVAVSSEDGTILVSPVPVTTQAVLLTQNTKAVVGVAFSPDGHYLASAGSDSTVRIFDAHTLAELRVIQQPEPVQVVAFTPDSKNVLSAGADGVWLWDACTDCENPTALLALARSRVTRSLTAEERRTFEPH
jgi:WD40 repeat protein